MVTRKRNILIVPCTEWLRGSQQRLHHFAEEWSRHNEVFVFYLERQDNSGYESNAQRLQYSKMLRVPTVRVKNYPLFLITNFIIELILFFGLIKRNKIDVVVAEGLGPSNAASIASKLTSRRFIFDISDSYPDFVTAYISNGFLKSLFESCAFFMTNLNITLSNASVIVSDGLSIKGKNSSKQHKIVNGVTEDNFPTSKELVSPGDRVIITFVGSVESWVNFGSVMDAVKQLNSRSNYRFTLKIIGDGMKLNEVKQLAQEKGIENSVIFTGWVPYTELHEHLGSSQICVLPFDYSSTSLLSMPMKIHEYAISKKPIITTPLPEIRRIYGKSVVYATTKEEYVTAINQLLENQKLRSDNIEGAYSIAKEHSWTKLAKKYESLLS